MNTQEYTRIYTRIHMYTLVYTSIHRHKKGTHGYLHFVYTSKQAYTNIRGYAYVCTVYTGILKHTRYLQFYTLINRYTQVKTGILTFAHDTRHTQVHKGIKGHKWVFTFVYTSKHRYTQVYSGIHTYALVYTSIHRYKVYTFIYQSNRRYSEVYAGLHTYANRYTLYEPV